MINRFQICFQFELAPCHPDDYIVFRRGDFDGTISTYKALRLSAASTAKIAQHKKRVNAANASAQFEPSTAHLQETWMRPSTVTLDPVAERLRAAFSAAKVGSKLSWEVAGRCRLTVSNPVLKAPVFSTRETIVS